jgi:hypothetical protein
MKRRVNRERERGKIGFVPRWGWMAIKYENSA